MNLLLAKALVLVRTVFTLAFLCGFLAFSASLTVAADSDFTSTVPPDYAPNPVTPPPLNPSEPIWVVDPYNAGTLLPPPGTVSLFDQLFVRKDTSGVSKSGYLVPTPLTNLISEIEAMSKPTGLGASRGVLIPMGRSLQRIASLEGITFADIPEEDRTLMQSMPDEWQLGMVFRQERFAALRKYLIPFFSRPRVVITPVAWPKQSDGLARTLLKERIYLGYHQSVDVLEVISYNDIAGRFEFQIVKNYSDRENQKVLYANRSLCIGCHQNHAPIFSVAPWLETNAEEFSGSLRHFSTQAMVNKYIDSSGLDASGEKYLGVPLDNSLSTARAIDTNTDNANNFSLWQLLWQEGCPDAKCRILAFVLMYRKAIEGGSNYLKTPLYRDKFLPIYLPSWSQKWPGGLKVPSPDIPVRSPLKDRRKDSAPTGDTTLSRRVGSFLNFVKPRLNPGKPRKPKTILTEAHDAHRPRMIEGFSRYFISKADFAQIESYLMDSGASSLQEQIELLQAKLTSYMDSGEYAFAFSAKSPFRRKSILRAVYGSLGVDITKHIEPDRTDLMTPQPILDASMEDVTIGLQINDPIDLFKSDATRCIRCHAEEPEETHYPNYMRPSVTGSDRATQMEYLTACAPQFYIRLRMWELPEDERRVKDRSFIAPMPIDGPITNTAVRGALLEFVGSLLSAQSENRMVSILIDIHRAFSENSKFALQRIQTEVEYDKLPECPKYFE